MNEVKNLYKFQIEDLLECFKFVKNFHLEPTKSSRGRTNQGKRGFGGELDAWIPGKLCDWLCVMFCVRFCVSVLTSV